MREQFTDLQAVNITDVSKPAFNIWSDNMKKKQVGVTAALAARS
jgi:hypothetical protein